MSYYKEYDKKTLNLLHKVELEMLKDINELCEKYNIKYFVSDGTGIGAVRHKGFIPWDDDIDLRFLEEDLIKFRKCAETEFSNKYYFVDRFNTKNYPITFVKMCKRGTLFIDENQFNSGVKTGISIDMFPMYYVDDNKKKSLKNVKKSWYLNKLAILTTIKKPVLPQKGIKKVIILLGCKIINFIFKIFKVKSSVFFDKALKIMKSPKKTKTIAYSNNQKMFSSIYDVDDIFPVKKLPFEDTFVYAPKNIDKILSQMFGNYMELPPEDKRHNHYPYKLEFKYNDKKHNK